MKIENELFSLCFLYIPFSEDPEAALHKLQNLYEITFHVAGDYFMLMKLPSKDVWKVVGNWVACLRLRIILLNIAIDRYLLNRDKYMYITYLIVIFYNNYWYPKRRGALCINWYHYTQINVKRESAAFYIYPEINYSNSCWFRLRLQRDETSLFFALCRAVPPFFSTLEVPEVHQSLWMV